MKTHERMIQLRISSDNLEATTWLRCFDGVLAATKLIDSCHVHHCLDLLLISIALGDGPATPEDGMDWLALHIVPRVLGSLTLEVVLCNGGSALCSNRLVDDRVLLLFLIQSIELSRIKYVHPTGLLMRRFAHMVDTLIALIEGVEVPPVIAKTHPVLV